MCSQSTRSIFPSPPSPPSIQLQCHACLEGRRRGLVTSGVTRVEISIWASGLLWKVTESLSDWKAVVLLRAAALRAS